MEFTDVGGGVPVLHLYGEAGGCPSVSSLLKALLLRLCAAMAYGAKVPMPPLPCRSAPPWAGELSLGGRSHTANRNNATNKFCLSKGKFSGQVLVSYIIYVFFCILLAKIFIQILKLYTKQLYYMSGCDNICTSGVQHTRRG